MRLWSTRGKNLALSKLRDSNEIENGRDKYVCAASAISFFLKRFRFNKRCVRASVAFLGHQLIRTEAIEGFKRSSAQVLVLHNIDSL